MKITPTVGRVIWYWPSADVLLAGAAYYNPDQPMAATIAAVSPEELVNLSVYDHDGKQFAVKGVEIYEGQELAKPEDIHGFAQWPVLSHSAVPKDSVCCGDCKPEPVVGGSTFGDGRERMFDAINVLSTAKEVIDSSSTSKLLRDSAEAVSMRALADIGRYLYRDEQPAARQPIVDMAHVARIAHEANRAYCQSIGDNSQSAWEDAPAWQRESVIAGVKAHIDSGLTMTPEQSHESWLAHKAADGWKYGPVKDTDKKEHPCFVPYDQLPIEQRTKDCIFGAIVRAYVGSIK